MLLLQMVLAVQFILSVLGNCRHCCPGVSVSSYSPRASAALFQRDLCISGSVFWVMARGEASVCVNFW